MLRWRARSRSGQKSTISIGTLLLEMMSVILGVLLALGAAAWKENRNHRIAAETAQAKIIAEVQKTLEDLSENLADNTARADSLEAVKARIDEAGGVWREEGRPPLGFDYTILSQTAWETAKITESIQHMDADFVDFASVVYGLLDLYLLHAHNLIAQRGTVAYNTHSQEVAQVEAHLFNLHFLNKVGEAYVQLVDVFLETYDPDYEPARTAPDETT